ncbi:TPA: hypothetical protein EYP70_05085 [Candidatus Bathyarchaeota archaeon]|nr:hypothetical protein [Candidatus Bathyarchaeota archaeon]
MIIKHCKRGTRIAQRMVSEASELKREPHPLSNLTVSIKCGASDTTLGIASNPAVGEVVDTIIGHGETVIFGKPLSL